MCLFNHIDELVFMYVDVDLNLPTYIIAWICVCVCIDELIKRNYTIC